MTFKEGEQVGPYRIMEQLGRGGMATVFKAYHANLDRYVAIKVMHPAFMQDKAFLARFQREAKVVAKMEHANIIPVYDFDEHDGRTYLVMKYVEGLTLKAKLNSSPLSSKEGVEIIEAIGNALTYAHNNGILHRDIKPSNVILSREGHVYLADFGLARIASAGESTMSGDMMIGTPQYISPEQAMGKKDLNEGADIYSFGVLIYELVVGKVPFSSDTPFSIVHDHIYSPLPLPRTVNPNVPATVERFLLKSLAKERVDRFDTVQDMVDAFKQALTGEELPENWLDTDAITASINLLSSSPTIAANASTLVPEIGKDKKKFQFKWWHAIPILIFLLVGVGILGSLSDNSAANNQNANNIVQVENNSPEENIRNSDEIQEQPNNNEENFNTIENAEKYVNENPEDAFGYLELSSMYLQQNMEPEAFDSFDFGIEFAENIPEYLEIAGDMFFSHEYYLDAVEIYFHAAQEHEGRLSNELSDKLRQSIFYATENPDFEFIEFPEERGFAPGIIDSIQAIAEARYILIHHGAYEEALDILDSQFLENKPLPEVNVIRAEALIGLDQIREARTILEELSKGNKTPPWVKIEIRYLLDSIN